MDHVIERHLIVSAFGAQGTMSAAGSQHTREKAKLQLAHATSLKKRASTAQPPSYRLVARHACMWDGRCCRNLRSGC